MQSWKYLKLEETGEHITTLTFNRPERRNALSFDMALEVEACLRELHGRAALRALILTGAGTAFGSGADLKERAGFEPERTRQHRETALRIVELLETLPAPVIAMVNGPAFAGSFEIALGCDIRVASELASFSLTEVRNAGSFPGAGGTVRLPKLVGRGRTNLVVLTGRRFSAGEAFALGFVEMVVPHDRLADETMAIAREIASGSPLGVRAAKKLIRQSAETDLSTATTLSRALRDPLDSTRDSAEGYAAWVEKRPPRFTGT